MRSSILGVAALASVGAYAAPVEIRDGPVTASEFTEFTLFSQYAAAAYCYNSVHNDGTINCSSEGGSCPLVESAQATIVNAFQAGSSDTLGFIATDSTNGLIVVSFQGTAVSTNPLDIITDVDIIRTESDLCGSANTNDGCLVHSGFLGAMQDAATVVVPAIQALVQANPSYKVVSTGHSLGGAIAALMGAQLRNDGLTVDIYTFGQPKVGDADISNYIQSQSPAQGTNYRVTHYNDVVPQLPEHDWENDGWDHYYPEFWINKEDGTSVAVSDMEEIDGSLFETGGNEGMNSVLGFAGVIAEGGITAHYEYFGNISSCSSSAPS